MFTGIIEEIGTVVLIEQSGSNLIISFEAPFMEELKIDQSVSHDGVPYCLLGYEFCL